MLLIFDTFLQKTAFYGKSVEEGEKVYKEYSERSVLSRAYNNKYIYIPLSMSEQRDLFPGAKPPFPRSKSPACYDYRIKQSVVGRALG